MDKTWQSFLIQNPNQTNSELNKIKTKKQVVKQSKSLQEIKVEEKKEVFSPGMYLS